MTLKERIEKIRAGNAAQNDARFSLRIKDAEGYAKVHLDGDLAIRFNSLHKHKVTELIAWLRSIYEEEQ